MIKNLIQESSPALFNVLKTGKDRLIELMKPAVPDEIFSAWQYRRLMGYPANLREPKTFNEKIMWLKLHYRDPRFVNLADKYEVRSYIKDMLGEEVLTRCYGVFDRVEDINLDALPDRFVLKTTHGSGQTVICKDKSQVNWPEAFARLKGYLQKNYYYYAREWVYKGIKPRIICEEFLDQNGEPPWDYKFWCCSGNCEFISVHVDRFKEHKQVCYNARWERQVYRSKTEYEEPVPRPQNFDKMLEYAHRLARGLPFLRIDFYNINGKIYFGELTFFPDAGMSHFYPQKYDEILGEKIQLPKRPVQYGAF